MEPMSRAPPPQAFRFKSICPTQPSTVGYNPDPRGPGMRRFIYVTVVVGSLFVSSDCSGSSTKPSGTSSTWLGTFSAVEVGQSGTLSVMVQGALASASAPFRLPVVATLNAQASTSATASLSLIGGGTASLSGTYNGSSLSLSGGGYSISGAVSGTLITGSVTVPSGAAGAFSTASTSSGSATAYCPTDTTPSGEKIQWLFNIWTSGDLDGTFSVVSVNGAPPTDKQKGAGTFKGTVTGTTFRTAWVTTAGPFIGDVGYAEGTMVNGVMSGVDKTGKPFTWGPCSK